MAVTVPGGGGGGGCPYKTEIGTCYKVCVVKYFYGTRATIIDKYGGPAVLRYAALGGAGALWGLARLLSVCCLCRTRSQKKKFGCNAHFCALTVEFSARQTPP